MLDPSMLEVSLAQALPGDITALHTELTRATASLNLTPRIQVLLELAAENEWCPIATLYSAGQLQIMSSWQIFTLFSTVCTRYFALTIHSLAESSGYAIIHQSNGNCIVGDADGGVDTQIISPLDAEFISYVVSQKIGYFAK